MNSKRSPKLPRTTLRLNAAVYPLDVVLSTCYVFLDRAYFHLDGDPRRRISVEIRSKPGAKSGSLGRIVGELRNELLSQSLRERIARENRKIRAHIVNQALMAAVPRAPRTEPQGDEELAKILADTDPVPAQSYLDDPLGIAIPWEEKYEKSDDPVPPEATAGPETHARDHPEIQSEDLPRPEHPRNDPKV